MTLDYLRAHDLFKSARFPDKGKPIANNTRIYKLGDGDYGDVDYAVRFHKTDIIILHPGGTYTLDSGGWRTVTTKERMNEFGPASIWQDKGIWYVGGYGDKTFLFEDGMKVDAEGKPLNPASADKTKAVEDAGRKLSRMVAKYKKGFMADLMANGLRDPSGGDCWDCYFTADNGDPDWGGMDHLLSHMEEGYYVPSLLWKAVQERAGSNAANHWWFIRGDLENGREPWLAEMALKNYFAKRRAKLRDALLAREAV